MNLTEIRKAAAEAYLDHADNCVNTHVLAERLAELAGQVPALAGQIKEILADERDGAFFKQVRTGALLTAHLLAATAPVTVKPSQPANATPPAATPPQADDVWGKAFAQAADRQADGPAGDHQPAGDSELWHRAFSSATAR